MGRSVLKSFKPLVCIVIVAVAVGCGPFKKLIEDALYTALKFDLIMSLNTIPKSVLQKDIIYSTKSPMHPLSEKTFQFEPEDDHTAQVCRTAMYLKWAEELHAGIIMTPFTDSRVTLPPKERAQAFLEICREVFAEIPQEQRGILEALSPVPSPWQFIVNVTHPWLSGRITLPEYGVADPAHALGSAYPEGSEEQWARDRDRQVAALPGLEDRQKSLEEMERLPPYIQQGLRELGIHPVRDVRIEPEEIPDALREGKTVVFDATKVCGPDIFNLTIPDIAELHGELADNIPVFKEQSAGYGDNTYDTLSEIGHRFRTWNERGWQHYPAFGPFSDPGEIAVRYVQTTPLSKLGKFLVFILSWYTTKPREVIVFEVGEYLMKYRQMNSQTTINAKRLPRFPLRDMLKAMGSPYWVERVWNELWIGPVGDFWHYDEPDNLLISVSGDIYVAVMEQNVTDIVAGTRNVGLGFNNLIGFFYKRRQGEAHWVDDNPWIRKIPIHFLRLRPGMGITIPSRTYHNVMALDGNRILLNCFFYPKWRAAEDAPSARYSYWKRGRQADTHRAMFSLKASTVGRLWDTRKVGGFFYGYKLEFF